MSNKIQLRVAELMCSRLCHDLISPISAINNGIELMNENDEGIIDSSIELLGTSAKQALDRLSFYRVAFGLAGGGAIISWNEIRNILEIFAAERKTTIVWTREPQPPDENISHILAKLVVNVVYLAMECLPRGGVISVDNLEQKAPEPIVVRLEGPKCNLRDDVQSGLIPDLPIEQLSVRNIVAYLATSFAIRLEKSLKVRDENSNSIVITIS